MKDSRRIAIVDDDESVQRALQDLLESEGLSTNCFSSAEQFLESEGRYAVDCIIADVCMPGMSGLELHAKLKNESFDVSIIFISAHSDAEKRALALREGALEFLSKPFDNVVLLNTVHTALERSASAKHSDVDHSKEM